MQISWRDSENVVELGNAWAARLVAKRKTAIKGVTERDEVMNEYIMIHLVCLLKCSGMDYTDKPCQINLAILLTVKYTEDTISQLSVV